MIEFVFSFCVLLLAFAGLGLGRLAGKKGPCRSCGGLGEHAGHQAGVGSVSQCPALCLRETKNKG